MAITLPVTGELSCKVVYYGPAASGKTTNLKHVYGRLDPASRGKLITPTDGPERTLFFDFLSVDMGVVRGVRTRFHLHTVPGQNPQKESRRLVLRGVDGLIFVADSHPQRLAANRESLADLESNLAEAGLAASDVPIVFQYNKRDLAGATPVEELRQMLNPDGRPDFEAVAIDGTGVLESLTAISRQVIRALNRA
ncbi:MAG: GTPase domain-containing protein [Candidatus Palauibacterales bacterium]|nr:GTPase domain-containing protein [Candidatus Palauibacterales bacterium]MDP2483755.1 GTPase domain-containing protein [Candidatus Palauibacterales bacterium]